MQDVFQHRSFNETQNLNLRGVAFEKTKRKKSRLHPQTHSKAVVGGFK